MEGEQVEIALVAERLRNPTVLLRHGLDLTQDHADVDGLAVVTAVIFA